MRPAKLHELTLPTKYQLWRRLVHGTPLAQVIGPDRLCKLLTTKQAIELVDLKGNTLCNVLNESKINEVLQSLYCQPWQACWPQWAYQVAKRLS